jgi:hypothetical protein
MDVPQRARSTRSDLMGKQPADGLANTMCGAGVVLSCATREHGMRTQNARSALRAPTPAAERRPTESAELAHATQQKRKGITRGHAASTPDRILHSD